MKDLRAAVFPSLRAPVTWATTLAIATLCNACSLSLPPPSTTTSTLSPSVSLSELCTKQGENLHFTDSQGAVLTPHIECSPRGATIVVINPYGLRVRTVTISVSGEVVDEASYLDATAMDTAEFINFLVSKSYKN